MLKVKPWADDGSVSRPLMSTILKCLTDSGQFLKGVGGPPDGPLPTKSFEINTIEPIEAMRKYLVSVCTTS